MGYRARPCLKKPQTRQNKPPPSVARAQPHLRLLDRGRTAGERRPPSSSVILSVLPKCLDRKCSSSTVGW